LKQKKAPVVDISPGAEALELLFRRRTERQATPTAVRRFIIKREKTIIEDKKTIAERGLCTLVRMARVPPNARHWMKKWNSFSPSLLKKVS